MSRRTREGSGRAAIAVAALALLLGAFGSAGAHRVDHRVEREGAAVVVTIAYGDAAPLSYESFEVFRPGESVPFAVGRTDAHGRAVFLPDTTGSWRLKAFTEDGHGLDVVVEAGPAGAVTDAGSSTADRWPGLVGGLAILFGAFGLLSLFYGKTRGGG